MTSRGWLVLALCAGCGPSGVMTGGGTSNSGSSGSSSSGSGGGGSSSGTTTRSASSSPGTTGRASSTARGGSSGGVTTSRGGSSSGGATTTVGGSSSGGSNSGGLWVTGYYVGFDQKSYPVASVDFAAMTHVVVGPVLPNADGSLDTTFSLGNAGPAWATSASSAAHAAGDKVLLWVGGSDSETGLVGATASANLSTFVSNLTAAMASYDADGVDIDWEPLASADEPAFTALLTALRSAAPNAILTIPIGGLNMNIDTVDPFYADVAPLVDQENVMSYGMAGPWQGWQSWHSSPIGGESPTTPESIDSSVQAYLAAGLPAAKLGIGIGFYGLCYTPPVTGPLQDLGGSTIAASDGVMSYANIMADYYSASAAMWDATALVPYLTFAGATGPQGCSYISYDDAQSVGSKAAYVKANGLGGTIIWEIAEGYTGGSGGNALMEAIRAGFLQ